MIRPALALATLLSFAALAAEDVPFVTTPDNVTLAMLRLAKVGPKDYVIDLGSGDGRIVITAASKFGASGLGVEIVPDLVKRSQENARKAGVETRAKFREQDLFKTDLTPATVVTLYLLPDANLQLRPALLALKPGTRIVSHDWDMGDWKPDRTVTIPVPDKPIGLEKSSRLHLWVVPAHVEGAWCATGKRRGATLVLTRSFQMVEGALARDSVSDPFTAQVDGTRVQSQKKPGGHFTLQLEDGRLRMTSAAGSFASLRGAVFARREGAACK